MPFIRLETLIRAAPAVCFDWARNAQFHCQSARETRERIVAGRAVGLWELGDEITFEGVHFGVRQQFTARITALEAPHFFRDEMTRGAFAMMRHTHIFEPLPGGKTRMVDIVEWTSPLGVVGRVADAVAVEAHLREFLRARGWRLKARAEIAHQLLRIE